MGGGGSKGPKIDKKHAHDLDGDENGDKDHVMKSKLAKKLCRMLMDASCMADFDPAKCVALHPCLHDIERMYV